MAIYSIDVKLYATAYIRADTAEQAFEIAKGLKDGTLEVPRSEGDVEISDLQMDDPDLPDLSFSPAMTIHGVNANATADQMECQWDGTEEGT